MAATPAYYILHGDDDIAIQQALSKLRAQMGGDPNGDLNTSVFEGEQASLPEILNAARSVPFLADKRLIIVRGLLAHLQRTHKEALDQLAEDLPQLPDFTRLIFIERSALPANLRLLKTAAADPRGYVLHCEVPKDTAAWITRRARDEYGVTIQREAAEALASVTGSDLRRADNELLKLACYVDLGEEITEADVEVLTPYVAEANVFEMVDALAVGDGRRALALMQRVLEQDPSDPGFRLFSLITRQFRLLLLAREHLDGGGSKAGSALASAIGVRSAWQAEKVARQSRAFNLIQLEQIYRRLHRYDVEMKTGQVKPRLALELLVASLARSA